MELREILSDEGLSVFCSAQMVERPGEAMVSVPSKTARLFFSRGGPWEHWNAVHIIFVFIVYIAARRLATEAPSVTPVST